VSTSYPLKQDNTSYGPLLTPFIELELSTVYGWRPQWFLVDTGAEFTVVPGSIADMTGIDLNRCAKEYSIGIEGRPVPARVGTITLRFGMEVISVRCHFLTAKDTPYLLGRMDLFSNFDIFFHNRQRRVSFTRITNN